MRWRDWLHNNAAANLTDLTDKTITNSQNFRLTYKVNEWSVQSSYKIRTIR